MTLPDQVGEPADSALAETETIRTERGSQDSILESSLQTFKLSKRRWAILFAISLFGLTSSLTGDLSSILHTMLVLLELPLNKYVYTQQLMSYIAAVGTFPTAWFIDRYGIRISMYCATILLLIRDIARALLFNPDLPSWKELKLAYWIASLVASSQLMTVFYCLPLKISENWFATSERSVAWTVMMSSISIGTSIAAYSFPRFIDQTKDVKPLFYLNLGSGIATAFVILCCITKSNPKYPPNERTANSLSIPIKYLKSIKQIFKQKDIMLHLLHEAIFEGLFISSLTVIQDILTSSGHDKIFVGNLMSINSLVSVVMIVALATFIHRVQNKVLACKIASLTRALLFIAYLNAMLYPLPGWVVLLSSISFSTCRSWALPNFNNMTAQLVSGIVSEATIAGIAITLTVLSLTTSQVAFVELISVTKDGKSDYTYSITFATVVCIVNTLAYLLFFQGRTSRCQERESNVQSPTT